MVVCEDCKYSEYPKVCDCGHEDNPRYECTCEFEYMICTFHKKKIPIMAWNICDNFRWMK